MTPVPLLTRVWTSIDTHFSNHRAARELHAMTDHQLADIGISRDQIEMVVYGARPAVKQAAANTGYRGPIATLGATRAA